MTASIPALSVSRRRFKAMNEVRELDGYKEENAINNQTYKGLLGPYDFNVMEKCCRQKEKGGLCHRLHYHGFAVQLQDDSISIIGNCCVQKFDVNAQIRRDVTEYDKEVLRQKGLEQVDFLLSDKAVRLAEVESLRTRGTQLIQRVNQIGTMLGKANVNQLRNMLKKSDNRVLVKVHRVIEYVDEYGRLQKEESSFDTHVGVLSGLRVFSSTADEIEHYATSIIAAINDAESVTDVLSTNQLNWLTSKIRNKQLKNTVELLEREERAFLGNKLFLLCFLRSDMQNREMAAQLIIQHQDRKETPKKYVGRLDAIFCKQLGAQRISIP